MEPLQETQVVLESVLFRIRILDVPSRITIALFRRRIPICDPGPTDTLSRSAEASSALCYYHSSESQRAKSDWNSHNW